MGPHPHSRVTLRSRPSALALPRSASGSGYGPHPHSRVTLRSRPSALASLDDARDALSEVEGRYALGLGLLLWAPSPLDIINERAERACERVIV